MFDMKPVLVHLIEDNSIYRKLLAKKLKEINGVEVAEFDSVESSLGNLNMKPDFVILDHLLTRAKGIGSIPIYKEFLPDSKIMVLSGQEEIKEFASAFEFGADHYIKKDGFEIARVMSLIEDHIKNPGENSKSWFDHFFPKKTYHKEKKTVYVLEDNPNSAFIIEHLLSAESNNKVKAFTRSLEFVSHLFKSKPDVVVLDYYLEEKVNGLDLLKRIKKEFMDVVVIILSGQKDVSVAAELMREGASYYFVKSKDSLRRLKSLVDYI